MSANRSEQVGLGRAFLAADAGPHETHLRRRIRRLETCRAVGFREGCQPSLERACLQGLRAAGQGVRDGVGQREESRPPVLRTPRREVRPAGWVRTAGVRSLGELQVLRRLGPDVLEPCGLVLGRAGSLSCWRSRGLSVVGRHGDPDSDDPLLQVVFLDTTVEAELKRGHGHDLLGNCFTPALVCSTAIGCSVRYREATMGRVSIFYHPQGQEQAGQFVALVKEMITLANVGKTGAIEAELAWTG
jgi:hypothetical protein